MSKIEYMIKVDQKTSLNRSYRDVLTVLDGQGFPTDANFTNDGDFNLIYSPDRELDDETVIQLEKIPGVKVKRLQFSD